MVGKFPAAKINFHSTIVIKLNPVEVRIRVIAPDFVDNNGIGQYAILVLSVGVIPTVGPI